MISIELALRPSAIEHAPRAFLIPSDDPHLWIDILVESGCPALTTRLYAVPKSRQDPRPAAVLAAPPAGHTLRVPARALSYAAIADRLFFPADSTPYPPALPAELAAALTWDVNILHPGLGLIGYRESDAFRLSDLVVPPTRRPGAWDLAVEGVPPPQPLTTVEVEPPPDITALLDQGRDDIGTELPQSLPREPNEPVLKPLLKTGMMVPIALAAAALASLRRLFGGSIPQRPPSASTPPAQRSGEAGGGAGGAGWLQKFFAAFAGKGPSGRKGAAGEGLAGFLSRHLMEQRRKELKRLLDMLAKSPDEGLRYAIPLAFSSAPRGIGAPGGSLSPRDISFNFNFLRGGNPIDPWDIPGDVQTRLRANYRRLANRELALGRHRRAAYIFAQLLGDISAAASALQQGRFYRDAAILYRERLHQPLQAATCLEEGGLLTEAIDLYNTLAMYEKVGDLYTKLGQEERATAAYRTQVERLLSSNQVRTAATLLESKLRAPDEALAVLDGAWPGSGDAAACLEESFSLRARLARHAEAAARLVALTKADWPAPLATPLVQILARLARNYSDAELRTKSADATRVLAGHLLKTALPVQATALVSAVTSLDTDDRLLARDGQRFLKNIQPRATARRSTSQVGRPRVVREFSVAFPLMRFAAAFGLGSEFVLLGHSLLDVKAVFSNWSGGFRTSSLPHYFREPPRHPVFIAGPYYLQSKLGLLFLHEFTTLLHTTSSVSSEPERIVPPFGGDGAGPLLGMCADPTTQTLWTLRQQNDVVLTAWDMGSSALRSTKTMDDAFPAAQVPAFDLGPESELLPHELPHVPMISRNEHLFFALRNQVLHLAYLHRAAAFAFRGNIHSMTAADPLSRIRVAVVAEEECRVITADGRDLRFGEGMYRPLTTFTRGGTLVACDGHELRVYRTENDRLTHGGSFQRDRDRPLALLPTNVTNQFAAIDAAGSVQVFEIDE